MNLKFVLLTFVFLLFFFLLALLLEARCHSFSLKYIKGSEKWHNHRERRCGDDTNSIMFRYSETGGWKERKAEIRTMPTSNFEVPYTNQLKNDIFLSKISSLTIYTQFLCVAKQKKIAVTESVPVVSSVSTRAS